MTKVKGQGSERRGNIYRRKFHTHQKDGRRQGEDRHDNIAAATASANATVDGTSVHVPTAHW